jgi:hypothetical protein
MRTTPTYLRTYVPTYLRTYIPTYVHTTYDKTAVSGKDKAPADPAAQGAKWVRRGPAPPPGPQLKNSLGKEGETKSIK